jgi:hypothetical protein
VTVSASAEVLGVSLGANATLDITNNAIFRADEGTATGKNLGIIQVETGATFIFGGVLNNQNTIQLGIGAGASFFVSGDTTLKGGGNFYLSDTINNNLYGFDTLTNVDNLIAGAGRIKVGIINQALGTIEATSGGNKLVLFFNNVTNTGTLLGLGTAGLDIDGSVVTNIGGTIQANAGSFVYLEDGAKIIGGRLNTTANGDIVVKNAIFDGGGTHPITNDGNLEIQPPSSAEGLFTQGVIINHGRISLPSGAGLFLGLPSSPGMDTTLKGGGEVALNNSAIHLCPTTTLSKPLTLNNVDNIISGYGAIGGTTTGSSLVLNNEPLDINANINNQALTIYSNVINSHLLEATGGGELAFFGFANVVANATGTIKADTGSFVDIFATIKGGRLEGAGNIGLGAGATLDGSATPLTNAGNVFFSSESFATLKGTINNTGRR